MSTAVRRAWTDTEIAADVGVDVEVVRAVEARLRQRSRAYSTAEVAAQLNRTERAVREDCRRGVIEAVWTGRRYRIPDTALEAYLASAHCDDRGRLVRPA